MDIGKSFGFVFEDEKWVTKVLIGGVLNLIPVVNLANVGYSLRTLKNVAAGAERPLPDWDDFGDFFVKGLLVAVGALIYSIPLLLLLAMSAIVTALAGGGDQETLAGVAALCSVGLACVESLYGLVLALWLPAALIEYARAGEFGAFFRFGDIWSTVARNLGNYVVALVVAWLASLVAGIVGAILCGVGVLFTGFWATVVSAHLLGQVARESTAVAPAPTI